MTQGQIMVTANPPLAPTLMLLELWSALAGIRKGKRVGLGTFWYLSLRAQTSCGHRSRLTGHRTYAVRMPDEIRS